jgi:uncharacterized glyoxalase superfamily protein PhnB
MAVPKLNAVILNVADSKMLKSCRDWYLRLGLELSSEMAEESVFFNTGNGALLALHTAPNPGRGEVGVYLEVEDVEKLYERLVRDGIEFRGSPQKMPWGYIAVWLYDPAGHQIALVTPY